MIVLGPQYHLFKTGNMKVKVQNVVFEKWLWFEIIIPSIIYQVINLVFGYLLLVNKPP